MDEALAFKHFDVGVDHELDQLLEANLGFPAELALRLGWIADEQIDFGRAFVAGVILHVFLPIQPDMTEGFLHKLFDRMGFVRGQHIIVRLVCL